MILSSIFRETGFSLTISPLLLVSFFFLMLALWIIFTIILRYHWKNYGTKGVEVLTMNFVYLSGSIIIIAFMGISAILYWISSGQ